MKTCEILECYVFKSLEKNIYAMNEKPKFVMYFSKNS